MPTKADFIEQGRQRFKLGGARPVATKHWSSTAMQEGWDEAFFAKKEPEGEPQPASIVGLTSPTGRIVSNQPNLQTLPIGSPEAKRVAQAFHLGSQKYVPMPSKSKLAVVPVRSSFGIGSKNVAFFPRPVVCHLDNLSYRHQFAVSSTDADRYQRSSDRVIARWTKRINAAKVRNGLTP